VTVRKVEVTRQGPDLRVEIILSSPVQPSIETAVGPDRILLDLPGTVSSGSAPDKVTVNTLGLLRVRTGPTQRRPSRDPCRPRPRSGPPVHHED